MAQPLLSRWVRSLELCLILVLITAATCPAFPQDQPTGITTPDEFESFIDKLLAEEMGRLHIPGAVFVLVKDGHTFFAKGYGYADLGRKIPVSPDKTIFRLASVTKPFTATAIMQLAEGGKIRFGDDVNSYLHTFRLQDTFTTPVTIDNLLTHTGGFDEQFIRKNARTAGDIVPLDIYLSKRMPPRIMPPGEFIRYSNHGYALLGYVVQSVSGIPFDRYIQDHIFKPLEMTRSTVSQPLPSELTPDMAVGYVYRDGSYQAVPFDYFNDAPAGSLASTGLDMAHFLIAQLEHGRYGDSHILDAASVSAMQQEHFTPNPKLPGVCYGFWEYLRNNERGIQHDGGWKGFYSLLFMLPDRRLGFFLAANSLDLQNPSQQDIGEDVVNGFLHRYYPTSPQSPPKSPTNLEAPNDRFGGNYLGRIPPQHTFEKIISLFTQTHVESTGGGKLALSSPFSAPSVWVRIEPLVFEKADGSDYLAFGQDSKRSIQQIFMPEAGFRVPWYDTDTVQFSLIAVFLAFFLSTLFWVIGYVARLVTKKKRSQLRGATLARALAGSTGVLNLAFLAGLVLALQSYPDLVWYGVPTKLKLLLLIPCVTSFFTLCMLLFTWRAWNEGYWSVVHRIHYSAVAIVAVAFDGFLLHWNLLGFRY